MSILAGQNFASMEFQTKLHPTGSNQLPGFEFSPRDGYISIFAGRGGAEMGNSLCGLDQDPHVNMRSARAVKKAPLFALLAIIVCIISAASGAMASSLLTSRSMPECQRASLMQPGQLVSPHQMIGLRVSDPFHQASRIAH